jgi:hypothetical protein
MKPPSCVPLSTGSNGFTTFCEMPPGGPSLRRIVEYEAHFPDMSKAFFLDLHRFARSTPGTPPVVQTEQLCEFDFSIFSCRMPRTQL